MFPHSNLIIVDAYNGMGGTRGEPSYHHCLTLDSEKIESLRNDDVVPDPNVTN